MGVGHVSESSINKMKGTADAGEWPGQVRKAAGSDPNRETVARGAGLVLKVHGGGLRARHMRKMMRMSARWGTLGSSRRASKDPDLELVQRTRKKLRR